jgi:hypothetical protein
LTRSGRLSKPVIKTEKPEEKTQNDTEDGEEVTVTSPKKPKKQHAKQRKSSDSTPVAMELDDDDTAEEKARPETNHRENKSPTAKRTKQQSRISDDDEEERNRAEDHAIEDEEEEEENDETQPSAQFIPPDLPSLNQPSPESHRRNGDGTMGRRRMSTGTPLLLVLALSFAHILPFLFCQVEIQINAESNAPLTQPLSVIWCPLFCTKYNRRPLLRFQLLPCPLLSSLPLLTSLSQITSSRFCPNHPLFSKILAPRLIIPPFQLAVRRRVEK